MSEPQLPIPALLPDTEAFWRACHDGRLEINRCQACGWLIHPSRPVCSRCQSRDVKPQQLSGKGAVFSYTINYQPWIPNMAVPFIIALVELVEQKGLRLTTNLIHCPIESVRIGMPVKVVFKQVSDEAGLPLFEPDSQAQDDTPAAAPATDDRPKITATEYVAAHPLRRVAEVDRMERKVIISGVGQSAVGRRLLTRGDVDLTTEAALEAIADAGLRMDEVDGLACYPGGGVGGGAGFSGPGVAEMADALGLSVSWHLGAGEGPGQMTPVFAACLAVSAGMCRHCLVYRTVSEGSAQARAGRGRAGIGAGAHEVSGPFAFLLPFGAMSAGNWLAVYAARYMHQYGTRREHLGAIALAGRRHAAFNPKAIYREPITMDDYLNARLVSWPFGLFDCDVPCDGSTAVIVSHVETARDRPKPAVRVNAIGTAMRSRPNWDQWEDITTGPQRDAAAHLWSRTDLKPGDVNTAQLYDGFSFLTLVWLEALGFCKKGEGGPFMENGRIELGGALPINTWGGQLSGGRLHGFGFLAEAVRQVRREGGARQVPNCEVAAVGVGGGTYCGCMLLTR
jgi:acetyl-CoA acetyltransferase/uncharacterized OB-fold protein